jgi:hypothetical protein
MFTVFYTVKIVYIYDWFHSLVVFVPHGSMECMCVCFEISGGYLDDNETKHCAHMSLTLLLHCAV